LQEASENNCQFFYKLTLEINVTPRQLFVMYCIVTTNIIWHVVCFCYFKAVKPALFNATLVAKQGQKVTGLFGIYHIEMAELQNN
jgi:hypothetical protein